MGVIKHVDDIMPVEPNPKQNWLIGENTPWKLTISLRLETYNFLMYHSISINR